MKSILVVLSLSWLSLTAQAVTFTVDAEVLKQADGNPMPASGLVVLTAGISGVFYGPTPTDFADGDELILMRWDLSAFATDGVLSEITDTLTLGSGWNQGDPVQLYWYPTLTLADTEPGADSPYGTYRDTVGIDGSDPWVTPAQSDTRALKYFTIDASFLSVGGSNSADSGRALQMVIPEPAVAGLLLAGGAMLATRCRHVRGRFSSNV